jgi:hypothetical protein
MTSDTADPRPINDQGPERSHPQDTGPNLMAEALRCALRGWRVFPVHSVVDGICACSKGTSCDSPGKHPRTRNGGKAATIDKATIRDWWTRPPDANIGIATGAASNLFVLDVDPRHGGDDSLDGLIAVHGPLPDTVEVLTSRGRRHIYFTYEGVEAIGGSVSKLGSGLDVRSDGGYVVGPGSMHVSGRRYEWEASSHPHDTALAAPPEWIIDALTPTSDGPPQSSDAANGDSRIEPAAVLAGVPEGERNDRLFRFVSRHRGLGLEVEEAMPLALIAGRACEPPLPDGETKRIVQNVYDRYEPRGASSDGSLVSAMDLRSPKERFPIHWGNEVEDLPSPEWLIDGVMTQGSFVVLYGAAGTGKTFTALDMAGAIGSGQPWQGHDTLQGPVIYVAAEGVGDLGLRHEALRLGRGLDDLPDLGYITEPVNLHTGNDVGYLINLVSERRPRLVVVDTLARSMDGGDENVVKDMNAVIKNVDHLRHATGAAVQLIHHTGHDKSRERGSSALKGAADVFIKLRGNVAGSVTMVCDKIKMAAPFDDITIRFESIGQSLAVVSRGVTPTLARRERTGLMLVSTASLTNKDWLTAFVEAGYGAKPTFNRALKSLKDKGYVEGGGGVSKNLYAITEGGREALGLTGANEVSDED